MHNLYYKQKKHESHKNKSSENLWMDTRTAQFVHLSVNLGKYPQQTS